MVEHLVLFKLKPEATEAQVEAMFGGLRDLKAKIPGIVDLSVGRNFTDRGKGYEIGLTVRLGGRSELAEYLPHPAHQAVLAELIRPIVAEVLAVDYEF